MRTIALTVNGKKLAAHVESRTHLADFLRENLGLTGTHLGCEHGICGACTLLLDGVPVRSCITFAIACDGAAVTTIEGLDQDEITEELRQAFSREHALQCGYCTPGMLVSARDVVMRAHRADEREIRIAMSGNLCRCTGYVGIVRAIGSVIESRRARRIVPLPAAGRRTIGPAGSGHAKTSGPSTVQQGESMLAKMPLSSKQTEAPIAPLGDFTPQMTFTEDFLVHHPREDVWAFFGRIRDVAACLPGASITSSDKENVRGKMRIKVGPIAAEFEGAAFIERDPSTYSGTIRGSGRDARSSSATRGQIRYRLAAADSTTTRVEVAIGYSLTGPLAQFNRSALVSDIASRLTKTFVQNLETRLTGREMSAPAATELNAGALLLSVIAERVKRWVRKLRGRRDP